MPRRSPSIHGTEEISKILPIYYDTNFFTILVVCCLTNAWAQKALEEIKETSGKFDGIYYAYPTPSSAQTPAPDGYTPFYISHYGRNGSRYILNNMDYKMPLITIQVADSMGMLTLKGKEVLKDME